MSTDLNTNRETVTERAAALAADLEEVRTATKRLAADSVDAARQTARDFVAEGQANVLGVQQGVEGKIREKPVKSVLMAAAVGFLMGVFWKRR